MSEPTPMDAYARRVERDKAIARRRSLVRRTCGPLFPKYLAVVPSVFTARGELAVFRLLQPAPVVLDGLRQRAILTLDSASEILAGFRFGKGKHVYCYLPCREDLAHVEETGMGERQPGTKFPLGWAPAGWQMLFAVVPREPPPYREAGGFRVVTPEHLVREFLGSYGLRPDLLGEFETKLVGRSESESSVS